ncbi:MAG: hypothetical protein ACI9JN_000254 [Bacteroidia bacterium]|jgi:hypothetical protein
MRIIAFLFVVIFGSMMHAQISEHNTRGNTDHIDASVDNTIEKGQQDSAAFTWTNDSISFEHIWAQITQKGGCLIGQQYTYTNTSEIKSRRTSHSVFGDTTFQKFMLYNPKTLSRFLILQLSDTSQSHVHTCPFFVATRGEFAVYCLQQIHQMSWYDFLEFSMYKGRETTMSDDCLQSWLQAILESETTRVKMESAWQALLHN